MAIRVYTTKICPNCKKVKEFLAAEGEAYEEVDITTAEALTELRMNGVFTLSTPVVQIGSTFLTDHDLFNGEGLRRERIKEVIKPLQGLQVSPSGACGGTGGARDGAEPHKRE